MGKTITVNVMKLLEWIGDGTRIISCLPVYIFGQIEHITRRKCIYIYKLCGICECIMYTSVVFTRWQHPDVTMVDVDKAAGMRMSRFVL